MVLGIKLLNVTMIGHQKQVQLSQHILELPIYKSMSYIIEVITFDQH